MRVTIPRKSRQRQVLITIVIVSILICICNQIKVFDKFSTKVFKNFEKNSGHFLNFSEKFMNFPWHSFESAGENNNSQELDKYSSMLINDLTPFLIRESYISINKSCKVPPLDSKQSLVNCTLRKKPVKIALLLQFSFEVDNLEIHFNELYDLVDKFFIVESTRSHFRSLRKPLIWSLVQSQERFSKFLDKVVNIVVDDTDIAFGNQSDLGYINPYIDREKWRMEDIQEKVRWDKFLEWNNATNFFTDHDLLGFGDTDEVASRRSINFLKNCEFGDTPVDIGIWFPFGNIHQAIATDFPIESFPFTLGDPTFWTFKSAKEFAKNATMNKESRIRVPSRNRGQSPNFILGGMHLSHYGYLPLRIVHKVTATEGGLTKMSKVKEISERLKLGKVLELEKEMAKVPGELSPRVVQMQASTLEQVATTRRKVAILPWFYDCNRARYPSWEGHHDLRID